MRRSDQPGAWRGAGILVFGLALLAAGCTGKDGASAGASRGGQLHLTDSYNREIIFAGRPARIVSCAPNMTEIVFLLGAGNKLVGRTDYCDYPPEAAGVESVGSLNNPNIEKIISLKPDVVLASNHFQKETLAVLENLRIPVYVGVVQKEYSEVYELVEKIGRIVDKDAEAGRLVEDMKKRIAEVARRVQTAVKKPKTYYMISFGDEGDFTAGSGSFISYLIGAAGGENIGDEIQGWQYSVEALFRGDPDIIIAGKNSGAKDLLPRTSPYRELRAVKEGRVYEIDNDLLDRMGPRNVAGLEILGGILHPEAFR